MGFLALGAIFCLFAFAFRSFMKYYNGNTSSNVYEAKIKIVEDECEKVKNENLELHIKYNRAVYNFKHSIIETIKENDELKNEKEALIIEKNELTKINKANEEIKKENLKLAEEVRKKNMDLESMKINNIKTNYNMEALKSGIYLMEEKIEILSKKFDMNKEKLKEENERIKSENRSLKYENEKLNSHNNKMKEEIFETNTLNKSVKIENEKIKSVNEMLKTEIEDIKVDKMSLETRLKDLKDENNTVENINKLMNIEMFDSKTEKKNLETKCEKLKEEILLKCKEISKLQEIISKTNQDNAVFKEQYTKKVSSLEKECDILKSVIVKYNTSKGPSMRQKDGMETLKDCNSICSNPEAEQQVSANE